MSVLKELFYGKIRPIETNVPKTEEYRDAVQETIRLGKELSAGLTKEQKGLLNAHEGISVEMRILEQEEIFRQAFLLGVEMQKEIDTKD